MAARDVIVIAAILFTMGLGFFIAHYSVNTMVDELISNPTINVSNHTVQSLEGTANVTGRMDYVVFGLFIGLILALIITGYFIGGNPLFMFIYFIFVVLAVVISAVLANTWYEVANNVLFSVGGSMTKDSFPITDHLLSNLPIYMTIIGFIGLLSMFAKPFIEGQAGGAGNL
jgi:hypothetical protein